eukprot:542431-Pelagomonas_calceolata.AAC.3
MKPSQSAEGHKRRLRWCIEEGRAEVQSATKCSALKIYNTVHDTVEHVTAKAMGPQIQRATNCGGSQCMSATQLNGPPTQCIKAGCHKSSGPQNAANCSG